MTTGAHELHIAENSAAISASFHQDTDAYQKVYDATCDEVSGFPGIWNEIAKIGIELADIEMERPLLWETCEWIELCDAIASWLHGYCPVYGWPEPDVVRSNIERLILSNSRKDPNEI